MAWLVVGRAEGGFATAGEKRVLSCVCRTIMIAMGPLDILPNIPLHINISLVRR